MELVLAYLGRKKNTKPLDVIVNQRTGRCINFFISMDEVIHSVDEDLSSDFICCMYS